MLRVSRPAGHGRLIGVLATVQTQMSEQIHKRSAPSRSAEPVSDDAVVAAGSDKLKADIDDLLDEIDDVLETNAEDFVKSYVQKGGQ